MKSYSPLITVFKMAPPVVLIVLLQAIKAALKSSNIELSDEVLYSLSLALYAGFIGLKNWFKNGHKKAGPGPDQEEAKKTDYIK